MHNLIGKFLAGEASEEEKIFFEKWLEKSNKNRKEFDLHKNVWENTIIEFRSSKSEDLFKDVLNKIDGELENEEFDVRNSNSFKIKRMISITSKIAASILLIATVWYYLNHRDINSTQASVESTIVHKQNPSGQKSKIYLPDGSEVVLNAESKISFPETFSENVREVILEGEAFFDVIKKSNHPFTVSSGGLTTTVLGTSFNIKSFNEGQLVQIALKQGKVKVDIEGESAQNTVFLEPGEAVEYNKENSKMIKQKIDPDNLFTWKDGVIVFKDADLDEIIRRLNRWYGVKIEIKNRKLDNWTYTGTFDNENLENVLRSISFTEEFSYTIDQKQVTISFN